MIPDIKNGNMTNGIPSLSSGGIADFASKVNSMCSSVFNIPSGNSTQRSRASFDSSNYSSYMGGDFSNSANGIAENPFNENFQNFNIPKEKPAFIKDKDWNEIKKLDPKMQAAVIELYKRAAAKGINFSISSGLRTHEQQEQIFATARNGYAAKPGNSQHERGRAIDIKASVADKEQLGHLWQSMGLKWGQEFSHKENWHFDMRQTEIA